MRNVILSGHVIDRLKDIPTGIVQTIVTSPPYWGLRNYGTEPQIWGGDKTCEHQWNVTPPRRRRSENDVVDQNSKQATSAGTQHNLKPTDTCSKCGAWKGELGAEPTIKMFVDHLVEVFGECKRVLRDDGTLWVNMGDSYAGSAMTGGNNGFNSQGGEEGFKTARQFDKKNVAGDGMKSKDLCLIPARMAIALQEDGWYVRSEIIWAKPNPMPESVTDRPTKSHEMIYLLTKKPKYFYDAEAIKEPAQDGDWQASLERESVKSFPDEKRNGIRHKNLQEKGQQPNSFHVNGSRGGEDTIYPTRNKRDVWTIVTQSYPGAHFATFPEEIPEICIKAGTSAEGQCSECGKPFERIIDKSKSFESGSGRSGNEIKGKNGDKLQGGGDTGDIRKGPTTTTTTTTTGWKQSCKCKSEIVPQTVLDPFGGSGTTAAIANRLGRDYITIELNPKYISEQIQPRLENVNPLFGKAEIA